MKSWVAAPSLLVAGSRVVQAPEYPELSRTVIEPPDLSGAEVGVVLAVLEPPPPVDDELLHAAAAVSTIAAAPARQAVRIDRSRKLTGIHLLVIDRTLVGDKHGVARPEICLGYSHPPGPPARSINRGPPVRDNACIRPK